MSETWRRQRHADRWPPVAFGPRGGAQHAPRSGGERTPPPHGLGRLHRTYERAARRRRRGAVHGSSARPGADRV